MEYFLYNWLKVVVIWYKVLFSIIIKSSPSINNFSNSSLIIPSWIPSIIFSIIINLLWLLRLFMMHKLLKKSLQLHSSVQVLSSTFKKG